MDRREELTIGPCCYKTKIGHLLGHGNGTHPIWSIGDLKLELLLPFLCDSMNTDRRVYIDILLPVITRSTQNCIKSLLQDERLKLLRILTRDSNSLPLDEWTNTAKLRVAQNKYLSTQVVTLYNILHDETYVITGSLPQEVSQADQLLTLSTDKSLFDNTTEYINYLFQTYIR